MPPLCPLALPAIAKITITENGAKSPAEKDPAVTCADFSVQGELVRRYLSLAQVTNENDAHHTLDWSPCYASGRIVFIDGSAGTWTLSQSRTGWLTTAGEKTMVLYCPQCTFKPFE